MARMLVGGQRCIEGFVMHMPNRRTVHRPARGSGGAGYSTWRGTVSSTVDGTARIRSVGQERRSLDGQPYPEAVCSPEVPEQPVPVVPGDSSLAEPGGGQQCGWRRHARGKEVMHGKRCTQGDGQTAVVMP